MSSRFEPINKELVNIREQVTKVLEDTFSLGNNLPLDIYETNESVVILTGALLGLDPASLDIAISEGQILTLAGETFAGDDPVDEGSYLRRERRFGKFSRSVSIPVAVLADQAKASYRDHVLKITLPKAEPKKPRVVKITPLE